MPRVDGRVSAGCITRSIGRSRALTEPPRFGRELAARGGWRDCAMAGVQSPWGEQGGRGGGVGEMEVSSSDDAELRTRQPRHRISAEREGGESPTAVVRHGHNLRQGIPQTRRFCSALIRRLEEPRNSRLSLEQWRGSRVSIETGLRKESTSFLFGAPIGLRARDVDETLRKRSA